MKFTVAKVFMDGVPYYELWKGKERLGMHATAKLAMQAAEPEIGSPPS